MERNAVAVMDWLCRLTSTPDSDHTTEAPSRSTSPRSSAAPSSPTESVLQRKGKCGGSPAELSIEPQPTERLQHVRNLTSRALRRLTADMTSTTPDNLQLKVSATTSQPHPSLSDARSSDLQTPSGCTSFPSSTHNTQSRHKMTENVHTTRQSLREHGMLFNEKDAWSKRCPKAVREKVSTLFERARSSEMKEESVKAATETRERYYTQNEATVFGHLLPGLIKDTRTVKGLMRDAEGEQLDMVTDFAEDGLMVMRNCRFQKNLLPTQTAYTSEDEVLGLTDPVPDWTYGVEQQSSFASLQSSAYVQGTREPPDDIKALKNVTTRIDWAFLVIETKSSAEGIAAAENQAIRDGAVLLNARVKLINTIKGSAEPTFPPSTSPPSSLGFEKSDQADNEVELFVFSCAMTPDLARLSVHWFERLDDGREIFHMQPVQSYLLDQEEDLSRYRKDVHNVIDWGLLEYRPAADAMWAKLCRSFDDGLAER